MDIVIEKYQLKAKDFNYYDFGKYEMHILDDQLSIKSDQSITRDKLYELEHSLTT